MCPPLYLHIACALHVCFPSPRPLSPFAALPKLEERLALGAEPTPAATAATPIGVSPSSTTYLGAHSPAARKTMRGTGGSTTPPTSVQRRQRAKSAGRYRGNRNGENSQASAGVCSSSNSSSSILAHRQERMQQTAAVYGPP